MKPFAGLPDMEMRNWPKFQWKLAKVSMEIGQSINGNWPKLATSKLENGSHIGQ